jgi:hypothetical protein
VRGQGAPQGRDPADGSGAHGSRRLVHTGDTRRDPPLADAITDQPLLDGDEANPGSALSGCLSAGTSEQPDRLTSTVSGGIADTKDVREALVTGSAANVDDWLEVDLDTLRERGKTVGLAAFLDEVEAVVVPLLDPTSREAPGR